MRRPRAMSKVEAGTAVKIKRNPERTRERILAAAMEEFSSRGFGGARVDTIAERAGANKRMLYHYFGNKDELFLATLEAAYAHIRSHERELHLGEFEPVEAMRQLVTYTFDYFVENPHFIRLLNSENLFEAAHLKRSRSIRDMHTPLVTQIRQILERGVRAGVFRKGVDPVQLYISIAGVGYFYLSNIHTLSTIFGEPLGSDAAIDQRRRLVVDVILGYLRP
jgi:AcrR family transcriptional regulator